MKIDTHLTWGLVLIAFGWVCIALLLEGCDPVDITFHCKGSQYIGGWTSDNCEDLRQ